MKKNGAGFTLLEVLVAIGIMALVGTLIAQVFFTTTRSNTKVEITKDVKQSGDFAVEVMSRIIRNAVSITTVCAESGTTTSTITVTNLDERETTFGCLLDGTVTRIASTSGTRTDYLTPTNVTLGGANCGTSSLSFVCTTPLDEP